uniref:SFRICE_004108 n=1 Tax=Spodoptera frugiperda TaxID=7108 RepID=A0A2H1VN90_SPOFR
MSPVDIHLEEIHHRIVTIHFEKIQVGTGRTPLIMIQKHTFARTTSAVKYWHCSGKTSFQCPAKLRFDNSGNLTHYELNHNHPPPSLYKTKLGYYIRL